MVSLFGLLTVGLVGIMKESFPFVDKTIASHLICHCPAQHNPQYFGMETYHINFPQHGSLDDLVLLAHACDGHLFCNATVSMENRHPFAVSLANSATNPTTTMASTLLALNLLESTIRQVTGYTTGKAPLLKTMIGQLSSTTQDKSGLDKVCQLLLLPNEGLNLRNLLWHGFVAELPRPWLSLVLVTIQELAPYSGCNGSSVIRQSLPTVPDLRTIPQFASILNGASIEECLDGCEGKAMDWLPISHRPVFQLVKAWIAGKERPASCCALLSILLEHGLRLDWCQANDRLEDQMARPNCFFVTLDGHGQRHLHDLLLHPYVTSEEDGGALRKNGLIDNDRIPAPTFALLTDLFCSSSGGPNIRATVAHGVWDGLLELEWAPSTHSDTDRDRTSNLWDIVQLLLVTMGSIASCKPVVYQPYYSYTAVAQRCLGRSRQSLDRLRSLQESELGKKYLQSAGGSFGGLPDEVLQLKVLPVLSLDHPLLQPKVSADLRLWSSQDIYTEHELNQQLADAGLALILLGDVADAIDQLVIDFNEALELLEGEPEAHKRRRKSWLRRVHSSQLGDIFYTFAMQVSILSLQRVSTDSVQLLPDTADLVKTLKRTRMVVSTVNNFLRDKSDRAFKSAVEFTRGKAVRSVIEVLRQNSGAQP